MRFLVVTGLSGAGKTSALRYLEDNGYLCVDNLPPMMIMRFIELCGQASTTLNKVALAVDIRSGEFFDAVSVGESITEARQAGYRIEIVYLDAEDDTLISRYKETRRDHPLAGDEVSLTQAIAMERERLQPLREMADFLLDTTGKGARATSRLLAQMLDKEAEPEKMRIEIMSFGYKRGVPRESDLVFDVRFLPNPFYMPDIRLYTGLEEPVRAFVLGHDVTQIFLEKTFDLLDFLMPHYYGEGKQRLMICIGCTGGAHRSVAIAEAVGQQLRGQGLQVDINHRDIELEQALWHAKQ